MINIKVKSAKKGRSNFGSDPRATTYLDKKLINLNNDIQKMKSKKCRTCKDNNSGYCNNLHLWCDKALKYCNVKGE